MDGVEFSIITESFNLIEGASLESLRRSVRCATEIAERAGSAEVLLADVDGRAEIDRLEREFPKLRRIDARGLGYDAAKNRAVQAASGQFVVFLDGDCQPEEGWLDGLLAPLRAGEAMSTCGFTRYRGGFWAAVQSIMDFGFLVPREPRDAGCYACNNWASDRAALIERPIPVGLRCTCYPHAQQLERRGTPIRLVPDARVRHDLPPFFQERLRRGYDHVAVCWVDPVLGEHAGLEHGWRAVPHLYASNVQLDWERLRLGRKDFGLSLAEAAVAAFLFPVLRVIDVVGILRALRQGPPASGNSRKSASDAMGQGGVRSRSA